MEKSRRRLRSLLIVPEFRELEDDELSSSSSALFSAFFLVVDDLRAFLLFGRLLGLNIFKSSIL